MFVKRLKKCPQKYVRFFTYVFLRTLPWNHLLYFKIKGFFANLTTLWLFLRLHLPRIYVLELKVRLQVKLQQSISLCLKQIQEFPFWKSCLLVCFDRLLLLYQSLYLGESEYQVLKFLQEAGFMWLNSLLCCHLLLKAPSW